MRAELELCKSSLNSIELHHLSKDYQTFAFIGDNHCVHFDANFNDKAFEEHDDCVYHASILPVESVHDFYFGTLDEYIYS